MSITAKEIQEEGFEHQIRGYDVEQVDVFIDRVAAEVDAMNRQIAELQQQLTIKDNELAALQEAPVPAPEELENAKLRVDKATAELEKANSKMADALVKAEEAEGRVREAEARAKAAEEKIKPLQEQLAEKNKLDNAISQAFISAQRSADQLKEEARLEGERIYRESEAKAREFIREALSKKAAIYNEIDALQKSSEDFRDQYIKMVEEFAKDARERFANMEPPSIPDGIINEMLPDIESMPGLEDGASADGKGKQASAHEAEAAPQKTQRAPKINIPEI